MKKIILVILCIFSLVYIEQSYTQDMDEFDLQAKGGLDDNCDCGEGNFRFGISDFNTVNDNIALGIQQAVISAWLNTQEAIIFDELEKFYDTDFFNFHDASLKVLKDNMVNQGSYWKNHLEGEHYPKYFDSKKNKKLNLVELHHLQIRRGEIQAGNINNSIFSFSMAGGEYLKNIKDISKLNEVQNRIKEYYEVNAETEFIADEFRSKIDRFDNRSFGSHMKTRIDKYWNKDLENGFLDAIFSPNKEREDRIYLSQFYTNAYMLGSSIDANKIKEYEDSNRRVIKDMPKGRSGNILGFIWENMPDFNVNFQDLLNSFTEEDVLADLAIISLGEDNNTFLLDKPGLRNEIVNYFKENNFLPHSHDAINYLLNQYRDGKDFLVDTDVYSPDSPPLVSDENNPERALEFCSGAMGDSNGLPYFGNVLAAFFNEVEDNNYEGFIARNMIDATIFDVPAVSELSNSWYGENFKFVPHVNGCIKIHFDNGNESYVPTNDCMKRIGLLQDENFSDKTPSLGNHITISEDNFRKDNLSWDRINDANCGSGMIPKGSTVKVLDTKAIIRTLSNGKKLNYYKVEYDECIEKNKYITNCNDCGNLKKAIQDLFKSSNDDIITALVKTINKYGNDKFNINTSEEINHFLSQASVESSNFRKTTEGTTYSVKGVKAIFGVFFSETDPLKDKLSELGTKDCTSGGKPAKCVKNSEGLYNIVYNDKKRIKVGWDPIGNNKPGDGWNFRGRGVIQITGRENYTKFSQWYKDNIDSSIDVLSNPDLVHTNREIGALASLWYFKTRVMDRLSGGVNKNTKSSSVTRKINTGGLESERRSTNYDNFKKDINCK